MMVYGGTPAPEPPTEPPPAAHIAVFKLCEAQVATIKIDTSRCEVKERSSDTETFADHAAGLGVANCAETIKEFWRVILQFDCARKVRDVTGQIRSNCKSKYFISQACVSAVTNAVSQWKPSDDFMEEKPTWWKLALWNKCHEKIQIQRDSQWRQLFDNWCKGKTQQLSVDNLKTLGVSPAECVNQTHRLMETKKEFKCASLTGGLRTTGPHHQLTAGTTAHWTEGKLQDHVDDWANDLQHDLKELLGENEVPKGWQSKVHAMSKKSVALPGAALATMMVAVVFTCGLRHRHLRTVDLGDELLEITNSEESPE